MKSDPPIRTERLQRDSKFARTLIFCALLLSAAACVPSKRFSSPGCQRLIGGVRMKGLQLLGPRPLPQAVSGGEILVKRRECALGNTRVEQTFVPDTSFDATVVLWSGVHPITIAPRERLGFDASNKGINPTIACLEDRLVIYANPILGSVYAFDADGHQVWVKQLRPFKSLKSLGLEDADIGQLSSELNSTASLVTQVLANENLVAIEWRNGHEGIRQVILDENGVEVAHIGPWDGLLAGAISDGWVAVVGGGPDVTSYSGLCKVDLVLQTEKP
jgi:hypothetical protein